MLLLFFSVDIYGSINVSLWRCEIRRWCTVSSDAKQHEGVWLHLVGFTYCSGFYWCQVCQQMCLSVSGLCVVFHLGHLPWILFCTCSRNAQVRKNVLSSFSEAFLGCWVGQFYSYWFDNKVNKICKYGATSWAKISSTVFFLFKPLFVSGLLISMKLAFDLHILTSFTPVTLEKILFNKKFPWQ